MSLPYFNMYPTDFEAKTSHLTMEEDGAYNRLLRLCWMMPGCSLPDDDAWIMRRMRVDKDTFDRVVKVVLTEFFTRKNGRVSNARLTEEFERSTTAHKKRVEAGQKGGKAKSLKTNDQSPSKATSRLKQPEPEPEPELDIEEPKGSLSVSEKPTKKRNAYAEDFEAWWKAYPTDANMSKAEAGKAWKKLDEADRAKALAAVPPFKAWIAKQRDYRTLHAVRFLSQRRFDGFAQQSPEQQQPTRPVIQCNGAKYQDDVEALVKRFFESGGQYWEPSYGYRPDNEWTDVPGWMIRKYGGVDPREDAQNVIQFQNDRKSGVA